MKADLGLKFKEGILQDRRTDRNMQRVSRAFPYARIRPGHLSADIHRHGARRPVPAPPDNAAR